MTTRYAAHFAPAGSPQACAVAISRPAPAAADRTSPSQERISKAIEVAKVSSRTLRAFIEPREQPALTRRASQTVVHYGWIPTILVVAWRASNPRPPIMRYVCETAYLIGPALTRLRPHRLISPLA